MVRKLSIKDMAFHEGKEVHVEKRGGTFRRLACSSTSPCGWFVNISRTKRKKDPNYWHVTAARLNHCNCTSIAEPSENQLAATSILRSAVIADPNAAASTLKSQLQLETGLLCGRSKLYRAKARILKEVFSDNVQSIELLPSFLAKFAE